VQPVEPRHAAQVEEATQDSVFFRALYSEVANCNMLGVHHELGRRGTSLTRYWSVRVGDTLETDLVWSYPDPIQECPKITGLLCFFNERVDLEVEGEAAERPLTQWTREDESSGNGAQSLRGLTGAKRTS